MGRRRQIDRAAILDAALQLADEDGLDAVTTWGAWYHWRSSGLSIEAAARTMETSVHALLAATDAARPAD